MARGGMSSRPDALARPGRHQRKMCGGGARPRCPSPGASAAVVTALSPCGGRTQFTRDHKMQCGERGTCDGSESYFEAN